MAGTASPPFDPIRLGRLLADASGATTVEVGGFELLAGGAIQENWGFSATFAGGPSAGTHGLVLRTDAATGVPSSLGRIAEFAILRAVHEAGVTVAEPLWACGDLGVIGRPFFVMRRVAGTPQGREITTDPTLEPHLPALAARLGRELARLQTVRPPHPGLDGLAMVGPAEHIAGFRAYLDGHRNPRPVLEWAIRWLAAHIPPPLPPVLCHRDFRTGNYLVDGHELAAILDWEFAGWGDPDEDIGWLCCKAWRFVRLDRELGGIADRAPFCDAYEAASGRRLDPARVFYWEVLANVRWAIIALQQSDRHLSGGARDLSTAIIGRRATECELELLMLLDPGGAPEIAHAAPEVDVLRDLPGGSVLLELGREFLLRDILPLVPPQRHREFRLVTTAMAIAAREAQSGSQLGAAIHPSIAGFYRAPHPSPLPAIGESEQISRTTSPFTPRPVSGEREGPVAQRWEGEGQTPPVLLRRFATDLRRGAFELCEPRAGAARAILWRLTISKLREGNPGYLAANGFGD